MDKLAQDIATAVQVKLAGVAPSISGIRAGLTAGGMLSGGLYGAGAGALTGGLLGALRKPQQSWGQQLLTDLGFRKAPSRLRGALKGALTGGAIGGGLGSGLGGVLGNTYGMDFANLRDTRNREVLKSIGQDFLNKNTSYNRINEALSKLSDQDFKDMARRDYGKLLNKNSEDFKVMKDYIKGYTQGSFQDGFNFGMDPGYRSPMLAGRAMVDKIKGLFN